MIKYIILFLIINSSVVSYVYKKSSNILFSAIITAPVATVFLHFIDYILLGYIDPFIIFGFFITLFYCFLFSLSTLYCFKFLKNKFIHQDKLQKS